MTKDQEENISDSSPEPAEGSSGKRKRKSIVPSDEELEIDVNLPEPPSKKAKREARKKEKREKKAKSEKPGQSETSSETVRTATTDSAATTKRSDHGIWIGNLPWTATKESLRTFLRDQGSIEEKDIVRVHMPPPIQDKNDKRPNKPQNKGFAYVDFTSKAVLEAALELTEQLMGGRKVLIKNAKSYEGRPDKPKSEEGQAATSAGGAKGTAKPATKRVFVGNLDFAITQDDLREHFSQAGQVEDVFLATFEDSGKCKGYGWIRFADLEAAEAAVRGFIYKRPEDGEDGDEESGSEDSGSDDADETDVKGADKKKKKLRKGKLQKRRKWFINRLHGREMRREFAEDSAVRYNKRYGKQANQQRSTEETDAGNQRAFSAPREMRERPARKFDARNIAPAKALSNAPRASTAIVAGAGKKLTFDD